MSFLAVHPDNTEDFELPEGSGAYWTLGFWPPREAERIKVMLARLQHPGSDADPVKDYERLLKDTGISFDAYRDMVRYSLRACRGVEIGTAQYEVGIDLEAIDGIKHKVAKPEVIEFLHANKLLIGVALKAVIYNLMTKEQRANLS